MKNVMMTIATVLTIGWTSFSSANVCPSGYGCFENNTVHERITWGKVAGTNYYWRSFIDRGNWPKSWNNRADWFENRGRTHVFKIYSGPRLTGIPRNVRRGQSIQWNNVVSSNTWWR